MKICSNCNREYDDGLNFCSKCGGALSTKPLEIVCLSCGKSLIENNNEFCPYCGFKLGVKQKTNKKIVTICIAVFCLLAGLYFGYSKIYHSGYIVPSSKEELYTIGEGLMNGTSGFSKKPIIGKKFLMLAAEKNHIKAMVSLGQYFTEGRYPFNQDISTAIHWYQKAATYGDPQACYAVAHHYRLFNFNRDKAIILLHKAADQGYIQAYRELGILYSDAPTLDFDRAIKYYKLALKHEINTPLKVYSALGRTYEKAGLFQDAINTYKEGIAAKDVWSYYAIAKMYEEGIGIERNLALAEYYRKAGRAIHFSDVK